MGKKSRGNKSSTSAASYIPHILFIVAQVYCGFLVVFLLGPPVYAIIRFYGGGKCEYNGITLNFSFLLASFPRWWQKFSALTTGETTLVLFFCFLVGFVFAETFYRFATRIKYMGDVDLGDRGAGKVRFAKNDIQDEGLLAALLEGGIIEDDAGCISKIDFPNDKIFKKLCKMSIIKIDKDDFDYACFDKNIDENKLKEILEQQGIAEIEQILDVWRLFKERYAYFNIKNEEELNNKLNNIGIKKKKQKKQVLALWREFSGIKHFITRYYIQRDICFQRVWDWESFQSSFCLYIEGVLFVFDCIFGLSIINTLVYIMIRKSPLDVFWMLISLAILACSVILTFLMREARIRKYESLSYAHKAIIKLLVKEKNL